MIRGDVIRNLFTGEVGTCDGSHQGGRVRVIVPGYLETQLWERTSAEIVARYVSAEIVSRYMDDHLSM